MNTRILYRKSIEESLAVKQIMLESEPLLNAVQQAADLILQSYRKHNGCVFFAGNGGSAADAQHLAAEMVGRFQLERKGMNAEAVTVNTSTITSIANDYGYDHVFERAMEGKGKTGDVFVGISTSGNSRNIVLALQKCRELEVSTIGMSGKNVGDMDENCDVNIKIPTTETTRIQECHILIGHIICQIVEEEMFGHA